ncbi:MAG: xanthine dehydrogenase family protein subunit M [Anaerolineales bacterium]|nr:xanthine dehydrogenase family protein subunit M [Anaerolineales bacterium]
MKPAPFEYHASTSLDAALALKAEHGDEGKPLAGGQSLIPAMNFRVAQPTLLIDLNHIPELRHVSKPNGAVHIGSMTLQSTAERDGLIAEHVPLLHEAIPNIAHPQIRNRGTIGGSLAHADPASELPVVALALGARFRAQSSTGERWIEAKDFFAGLFATALQPDELLVEIAFPTKTARTGYSFTEVARRHGDYAMAGLAAIVELDSNDKIAAAKLVYLNVGDGPVDAANAAASLIGKTPDAAAFKEAGRIASQEDMHPFGNVHATPEYQRHLSAVLTERALATATQRAKAA